MSDPEQDNTKPGWQAKQQEDTAGRCTPPPSFSSSLLLVPKAWSGGSACFTPGSPSLQIVDHRDVWTVIDFFKMTPVLTRFIWVVFALVITPEISAGLPNCTQIRVPASTLPLGSSFSAFCHVAAHCTPTWVPDIEVEWRFNQQILTGTILADESGLVSHLVIPSMTETRAYLACCIRVNAVCHIMTGVKISAGYPPSAPQNLSCLTNLTKPYTLRCQWDPGLETHLPTAYTFHTKIRYSKTESKTYPVPGGMRSYTIPRADFQLLSQIEIFVTAANALGQASSEPLNLVPIENSQFDPPEVTDVRTDPVSYGCLQVEWRLSEHQSWVTVNLAVEMRWTPLNSQLWTSAIKRVDGLISLEPLKLCGLLPGMEYLFQIRVQYVPGPWSSWSNTRTGYTLEKAPTGQLMTWLKVSAHSVNSHNTAQLFWKPSNQFRANSRNISYQVFLLQNVDSRRREVVCNTQGDHCTFFLPPDVQKVYITAYNKAGRSSPTTVHVYRDTAREPVSDLHIFPSGDNMLLVQWSDRSAAALTGHTVEWSSLYETDHISFDVIARNESSFLITSGIEPYTPYRISVYSMYHNGIGLPQTVEGYSKQKAPSAAPLLQVGEVGHTHIKLTWDETPLEQRNGIIQSYTVYFWNEKNETEVVSIKPTERHVVLRNLKPFSKYKALIQLNTGGGSLNGTIVTLKTDPTDVWSIMVIVMMVCIGFLLPSSISALICFTKRKRLKMQLWPMVPDPANSSIRNWKETDTLKDHLHFQDIQDPTPLNLSRFSLLNTLEKELEIMGVQAKEEGGDNCNLAGTFSSCSPPSSPSGDGPASDSVPYVTVVFSSPYRSQTQVLPPVYLRSESTQPLLAEEPPSPASYQEDHCHTECNVGVGGNRGGSTSWDNFPLLSALKIEGVEVFN
ncbi:granulocyte colony-stimulating factor receptor [Arapaima gigas]